jgi:hypothetical protein
MIDINEIPCRGCGKSNQNDDSINVEERKDHYGYSTGFWCEECYQHNYPYKRGAYYDYLDAGEYLDDDY